MKILILGATGFVGRNMLERFADGVNEVHATWHVTPPVNVPWVKWRRADLREPFDLSGYDVIIQAAATTSGSKDIVNNPAIHVTDNAIMNALIFRAAHEAGVKHVIFFSCTTMWSKGHLDEQAKIDVHSKYFGVAHTKLYAEKMAEFYASFGRTKFTVVRHSNVYGPHDKFDLERSHVFGATVTKVMSAADSVTIWGSGGEARDLLYVSDLVSFVEAAISKQEDAFGLYNCGAGGAIRVKDLVQKIIDASGKGLSISHDLSAPSIPVSLSLDCSKAERELGWKPKVGLNEGIFLTLDWYREKVSRGLYGRISVTENK